MTMDAIPNDQIPPELTSARARQLYQVDPEFRSCYSEYGHAQHALTLEHASESDRERRLRRMERATAALKAMCERYDLPDLTVEGKDPPQS